MSGLFCFIFLLCLSLLKARPVTNPKVICLVQGLSWLCNYSPCSLFTSRTQKDNGRVSGWKVASNSWPFPSRLSPFRVLTRWWYRRHRVKGQSIPSLWKNLVWILKNEKDITFWFIPCTHLDFLNLPQVCGTWIRISLSCL